MKATELMIGDWILYGDKPVKVCSSGRFKH